MAIKLSVIGGGAAGFFGAIATASENPDLDIVIYEASSKPLAKVKVSGGGRCNVTNRCFNVEELVTAYPRGYRELIGAFHRFQPRDTISWFEKHGVWLKEEDDGRVFPISDSSESIINCFLTMADSLRISVKINYQLESLTKKGNRFSLAFSNQEATQADAVFLATGGNTSAYRFPQGLGHKIIAPVPSLFTFKIAHPLLNEMAGQTLPNVHLRLQIPGVKKPLEAAGPLLITHQGLSGPTVLKLSAFAARSLYDSGYQGELRLNMLHPAPQGDVLKQLLDCKRQNADKFSGSFSPLPMSRRLWGRLLQILAMDSEKPWGQINEPELRRLVQEAANITLMVNGKGAFKDEFVTCGGVYLKEIDFRTMESKICPGLYLAGELLDIDGITGGFNFQNAWTTAMIAGKAIAQRESANA